MLPWVGCWNNTALRRLRARPRGADLIALSEAGKLGLRRRIVLPFERKKFRETSVVDRPGEWGKLYDTVPDDVETKGDLVVIDIGKDADPYSATNRAILEQATALGKARGESVAAALVWDGVARGANDYTHQFGAEGRQRDSKCLRSRRPD